MGLVVFASVMLLVIGCFNLIYGIAAIADAHVFVAGAHYVLGGLNFWGWVTLIIGAVQLLAAVRTRRGVMTGCPARARKLVACPPVIEALVGRPQLRQPDATGLPQLCTRGVPGGDQRGRAPEASRRTGWARPSGCSRPANDPAAFPQRPAEPLLAQEGTRIFAKIGAFRGVLTAPGSATG